MSKRKRKAAIDLDEDIKAGEGDQTISDWEHGFDVIDEIGERLWDFPLELKWKKLGATLLRTQSFETLLRGRRYQPCFQLSDYRTPSFVSINAYIPESVHAGHSHIKIEFSSLHSLRIPPAICVTTNYLSLQFLASRPLHSGRGGGWLL